MRSPDQVGRGHRAVKPGDDTIREFRNDEFLDGIASASLNPRNDAGNFRIPYRDPPVKLGDDTD